MKALIKKYAKRGLWLGDVDMPTPGIDDVLIKIQRTVKSTTTYKLLKNRYIFMEGLEEMEFKGQVDDGAITWTEDIPDELLKMLGMED